MRKILALVSLWPFILAAQEMPDYPFGSIFYGDKGNHSVIYSECHLRSDWKQLDCEFNQLRLSYKLKPEEVDARLVEWLADIDDDSDETVLEMNEEICAQISKPNTEEMMRDFIAQEEDAWWRNHSQESWTAMREMCSLESASEIRAAQRKLAQMTIEAQRQVCKISGIFPWNESFKLQSDGYWVAQTGPSGDCGVIAVSTLKKDPEFDLRWIYESQKIVTNKEPDTWPLKCSDLDEGKYVHKTVENKERHIQCRSIEFGYF